MKFFIWLFIVFAVIVFIILIFSIGSTGNSHISLCGIETTQPASCTGIFLIFIFLYKGISAYALWSEDDMAIIFGIADAIPGIIICSFVMIVPFILPQYRASFKLRLEPVLLIPYLLQLKSNLNGAKEKRIF
jgi:hypothetical protein